MKPSDISKAYNKITHLWESDDFNSDNGMAQHKRAIEFVKNRDKALDVGCGSTGRVIDLLLEHGFSPEGVDVSESMVALAKQKHPEILFHHQDISEWQISAKYDFISAWDSIWHLSPDLQEKAIIKLINALNANGVLIFSFGGLDKADEHTNKAMGVEMYYSTLGVNAYLKLIIDNGCVCRHFEYDQYPELHAFIIIQKI